MEHEEPMEQYNALSKQSQDQDLGFAVFVVMSFWIAKYSVLLGKPQNIFF